MSVPDSIPLDPLDVADPDTDAAGRLLSDPPTSRKTIYRLAERGEIEGYRLSGKRLWKRASLLAFKAREMAKGQQLGPPATGQRKPGRPRKDQQTASAAE